MTGRIIVNTAACGLGGLLVAGCATTGRQLPLPEARPIGAEYPTLARAEPIVNNEAATVPDMPTGALTLEQALTAALLRNPELAVHTYGVRAAKARVLQAGKLPNPRLGLEMDEYDRNGDGVDSAQTTVALTQGFELGGKRRWRMRAAEAETELAGWSYERKRLDVFAETAERFVEVLAAQERLELAMLAVDVAQRTSEAVGERVKAGMEPPLQASKSQAELEMVRLEALTAEKALGVTRQKLAAMWGAEAALFETAEGRLDDTLITVPSRDMLRSRLGSSPDLARWDAELRLRRAALASEEAKRIPDFEATVGYQQFERDGTEALAFGIGMPLPIFDRNGGSIAAARHELTKAEAERSATELALATELAVAHAELTAAHERVGALRSKIVPTMERSYESAHGGYRQGKFGFLDMLHAQHGLFDAQASLVEARRDYQVALMEIQRLIGERVEDLVTIEEETGK